MNCYVYKGDKKEDFYLYLNHEFDLEVLPSDFPKAILGLMGELKLVIEFELDHDRKLQQAEAAQVISDIQQQGFYLQMPKKDMRALEDQFFS
ncbi:MAG: hypothetical protein ACI9FR_000806 [Cryomorphaceae bacterium]|jgi:uncharacterized protein YcgL (UPF0745 family)